MLEGDAKNFVVPVAGALAVGLLLFVRPQYFSDYSFLGALVGAEVLLVAVIKYRQAYFSLLISVFLLAGFGLRFQSVFTYARWVVLGVGAVAGIVTYVASKRFTFRVFHLIAFFCVLSAIVSALVSAYPDEAVLKATSLTLLFVYAATGARVAVPAHQPECFFRRLLIGVEGLTFFTLIAYSVFHWEYLGNPNTLGAVMGIGVIPVLLWGLISADDTMRRRRLGFELLIAMLFLMSSFARAAILGAAVSSLFLCVALKQYRLLIKLGAGAVVVALLAVMFIPQTTDVPEWNGSESISRMFLYKGHAERGVLGSRQSVWMQTWGVIKDNPWFGSGFGTSLVIEDASQVKDKTVHVDSWVVREHGNSYLAIAEWVGLLGVVPFVGLVLMSLNNACRTFLWVRRTGDALCPAIPAAAVIIAGLVHAAFEDWMFAVGYHLCVFFWVNAFILVDMLPGAAGAYRSETILVSPEHQFGAAAAISLP